MASFDFFKSGAVLFVCVMWHLDVVFMKSTGFLPPPGFCRSVARRESESGDQDVGLSTRSSLLHL